MDIDEEEQYKKALKYKKKEKKPREVKYFPTLNLKTKRSKKPQTEIQKMSNKIYGKNLQTMDEIKVFIGSEYKKFDDLTMKFLYTIAKSKVVNGKISFSDSLANSPIIYRLKLKMGKRSWLSNDFLYLASIFRTNFENNVGSVPLNGNTKIKSVTVISAPFVYEGDTMRGFIQDNSEDFFCFGVDKLPLDKRLAVENALLDFSKDNAQFTYLGKTYIAKFNSGCMLIVESTKTDQAAEYLKNQTTFNILSAKKRELKEKTLEIKNKPRFFSMKLIPDKFCPAYVFLDKKAVEVQFLYEIELDYNELFQNIITSVTTKDSIDFPVNFIYWDNISNIMDLFSVLAVVGPAFKLPQKQANYFSEICDKYADIEFPIQVWHKKMLEIQKLAVEFFNSFNSKLNYDKIVDIRGKVLKLYDDYKKMIVDSSYEDIVKFFTDNVYLGPFNVYCKNQLNAKKFQPFLENFFGVLTKIEVLDSTNLVEEIEKLGNAIYFSSFSDDTEPNERFFPVLLSPAAFYGNSINLNPKERKKYFDEIVTDFMIKAEARKDKLEVMGDNYLDIMTNLLSYRNRLLSNNANGFIDKHFKELIDSGLTEEDIAKAKRNLYRKLVNKADAMPKLNAEIYKVILDHSKNLDELNKLELNYDLLADYTKNVITNLINDKKNIGFKKKFKKKKPVKAKKKKIKKSSEIAKGDKFAGNYGNALQTIIASTTPEDVDKGIWKSGSNTFTAPSGPYDKRPVNPISQYLTEIIDRSGIYANEYFSDMKDYMYRENPYNIMRYYPIAPRIMTHVAKTIGLPTVNEAMNSNGVNPSGLGRIPEEDQEDLRQLNAAYLMTYPYTDPANIENIKKIKADDMDITPDISNKIEDFYDELHEKIQNDFVPYANSEEATSVSIIGDKSLADSGIIMNELEMVS